MKKQPNYNPSYVSELFDSMSSTYGLTNYISSFGFTQRWRNACMRKIDPTKEPMVMYDLMSGMGELWPSIMNRKLKLKQLLAVDISPRMNARAKKNKDKTAGLVTLLEQDILNNQIESNSADVVVSSFGLKTFSMEQRSQLAVEVGRILKPGGSFSFIEISVPKNPILKFFYMFYLKQIIPTIGWLFQGNSQDYRMLGIYTSAFDSCEEFHHMLADNGLNSSFEKLFFGCATLVYGRKNELYQKEQTIREPTKNELR